MSNNFRRKHIMKKKLTSLMLVLAFVITSILGVTFGSTEVEAADFIPFKSGHAITVNGVIYKSQPTPDRDPITLDSDKVYGVTAVGWVPTSSVDQYGLIKCKFYISKGRKTTGYVPVSDVVVDSPKRWTFRRKIFGRTIVSTQTYKTDYSAFKKLKADRLTKLSGLAMNGNRVYVVFPVKKVGNLLIDAGDVNLVSESYK